MSLRAIQQFVVHVESFRNIDLWYQGAYLLKLQIYKESKDKNIKQKVYAHPFAFTQEHLENQCDPKFGDTQIIKKASVHNQSSSFLSKAYLLKYYEEQVQLNDIVHFRVQTDISFDQEEFTLEVNLLFYDQQIKKIDPEQITLEKAKFTKTKKFFLKNTKKGIHQHIPLIFDGQYFSIANIVVHSLCVDYRYRLCQLQLFEFSVLSAPEKKKLLQKNKKISSKEIDYLQSIASTLKLPKDFNAIQQIQQILIKNFKKQYRSLLKQYRHLFSRVITNYHKQKFGHLLVNPSELGLFQDEISKNKNVSWQSKIQSKYKSKNMNNIIQNMLNQTNLISGQLLKLWHYFIDIIKISPRFANAHYEDQHLKQKQTFWNQLRRVSKNQSKFLQFSYVQQHNEHIKLQKQLHAQRIKLQFQSNVISEQLLMKKKSLTLMVEDVYADQSHTEASSIDPIDREVKPDFLHLVVLVHGFQGNSIDMKLIKNTCSLFYPEAAFLCSTANEELTDTDIIDMGNRLANQVRNYILEYFPPDSLEHISFIGHSLGGVIIRAALPRLLDMKSKFHAFITFSSPHLGYKVNASSVIEAGIWFLQKFKNSNCLKQLTLQDSSNLKQTALYKISKFQGLKHFKEIFLFSSKQDSYAPFQSARIQIHPQFMNTKDMMKQIHCQMVNNILHEVSPKQLHRIIVNFTIEETNLDSLIGRTAHILFLQNTQLIQMFLLTHPEIFA